jgi:dipeptidyl-peptidase-3
MNHFRKGVLGLPLYNPDTKKWGQAHTQGAYVFAMWFYKNQKSKIVDFEIIGDNEDFRIHLNEELLMAEGPELLKQLLIVIQTYKSSGAVDRAAKFYAEYSEVSDFFLQIRQIVINQKKPRRLLLNNNLVRQNAARIEPVTYPETFEGIILSFADRYQFNKRLYNQVTGVWN